MLSMSDLLGDLKDEYEDVLKEHPMWYVDEVIVFDPKMYHLILRDKISGKVVKWNKTMKGISLCGDPSRFSSNKLHLYRNPVIDFVVSYSMEINLNFKQWTKFGTLCTI